MNLLITGGAGYIGSHVVLAALEQGHRITVFDNLSTGNKQNIPNHGARLVVGSTQSKNDLLKVFDGEKYDGVIHLAASKAVEESMKNPKKYSENNLIGSLNLLNACCDNNVKLFVFSSSAAVYGIPKYNPIDEMHSLLPNNYYGYTKLSIEQNLNWYSKTKNLRFASLRYFNAAGYDLQNRLSCREINPQNLIPSVMEAAIGIRKKISIFGADYKTIDGTGVRDYIHVSDLASAHIEAMKYLSRSNNDLTINLGTGVGLSVLEIIHKTMQVSGVKLKYEINDRRNGDTDTVIAKASLARQLIGWKAKYSDIDTIIKSTWKIYSNL